MEWVIVFLIHMWGCLLLMGVFAVLDSRPDLGWKAWLKWPAFVGGMLFLYACFSMLFKLVGLPV